MQIEDAIKQEWAYLHAWAVPNKSILLEMVKYSPIVEIGAGTGYWASKIKENGGKIDAYDACPPRECKNIFHGKIEYYPIKKGGPDQLTRAKYKRWSLFLCWPPPNNAMAFDCMKHFQGNVFLYAGNWENDPEGDYPNANEDFFSYLNDHYNLVKQMKIANHLKKKHSGNDVFVILEKDNE